MKRVVVTGGCGFIGSNLVRLLLSRFDDIRLVNVDALTYAGNRANLSDVEHDDRYRFEQIDIRDRNGLSALFDEFRPDALFHLAAESHVDNSISGPGDFITTNIVGTYNLLMAGLEIHRSGEPFRFLHVSTDEVYGELGADGAFRESDPYRPNSPYSASKGASDLLVRAWGHTYGLDVVTTNCSNNFGPHQHREKLIPTVIATALARQPIPVYGRGENVRDWLFVEDHCRALIEVFERGRGGETYLVGTRNEWKNIDLVRKICGILDEERGDGPEGGYSSLITFVQDRPGHDHRYAVDPGKIESELGWRPHTGFEEGLRRTVLWYADRSASNAALQQTEPEGE